jgi:hypothetical protein
MTAPEDSTELAHLYEEFSERFRAHDDEAVRRIYRELLRLGRPRAEIVDAAVRFASNGAGFSNPPNKRPAGAPTAEAVDGADPIAEMPTAAGFLFKASKANSGAILPLYNNQGVGKSVFMWSAECASASFPEITQDDVSDKIATPDTDLKIASLSRSAIPRLACALAGIAVAIIIALGFLPKVSTAEKTTPSFTGRSAEEPLETVVNATDTITGAPDLDISNRAAAHGIVISPDDKSGFDTKPFGRGNASPSARGMVATVPHVSGQGPQTVVPPSTSRNTVASPDLSPRIAPLAAVPADMASDRESRLSIGDAAVLLARGDALFGTGDLFSARLFYERAANAGSGQAALRLGESYDPHFLESTHLRAARGAIASAMAWYKRARDLGVSEATILLDSISEK